MLTGLFHKIQLWPALAWLLLPFPTLTYLLNPKEPQSSLGLRLPCSSFYFPTIESLNIYVYSQCGAKRRPHSDTMKTLQPASVMHLYAINYIKRLTDVLCLAHLWHCYFSTNLQITDMELWCISQIFYQSLKTIWEKSFFEHIKAY